MSAATFDFTLVLKDGTEQQIALPAKFVVCHRCEGTGTHVNPSIDGNGLTREDFEQDPDFEEAYFAGAYDVRCETCKGQRVISEVDRTKLTKEQKRQLREHERLQEQYDREDASEAWLRRAESGERW
jgi:hypothetical protein